MRTISKLMSAAKAALAGGTVLAGLLTLPAASQAQVTLFGTPANFDVLNDTGQDAHGFEIELQGIQPADLTGVWSYTRFPHTILTTPTGIIIHYESPYVNNQWQITTVTPAVFAPTLGHSCVGGAIQGCEHYGYYFAYNGARPTNVINRWLVEDSQNPGHLIPAASGAVQIPLPSVSIGQVGQAPAVVFQIPVPPPPPAPVPPPVPQYGPARWVKVLKNEVLHKVAVEDLLENNVVVPDDANPGQVETAWQLLQYAPGLPESETFRNSAKLGQGSKAVVRKYEFYKYAGAIDPVTKKAMCGGDGLCTTPQPGELGDYIGTQMAAANVGVSSVTVTKAGTGSGSVSGTSINCGSSCFAQLPLGTVVTLTAKPDSKSVFSGWTGDCVSTQATCTFTINGENTVTANFAPVPVAPGGGGGGSTATFRISVSRNGKGTVTANPSATSYPSGTVVTLTATPDAGQPWNGWAGACTGTATTCTLTMDSDKSVTANFR